MYSDSDDNSEDDEDDMKGVWVDRVPVRVAITNDSFPNLKPYTTSSSIEGAWIEEQMLDYEPLVTFDGEPVLGGDGEASFPEVEFEDGPGAMEGLVIDGVHIPGSFDEASPVLAAVVQASAVVQVLCHYCPHCSCPRV